MGNVTAYRAHSLMPSAAEHETTVSKRFQERQAEGQRPTFIYITESPSDFISTYGDQAKTSHIDSRPDLQECKKGNKLSIQVEHNVSVQLLVCMFISI